MSLRVGILTSNDVRHRYFANAVAARFDVTAVAYQETGYVPADTVTDRHEEAAARIVRYHFDERRRQELAFFGHGAEPLPPSSARAVRLIDKRALNTSDTADMLEERHVDVVLVYGTDLIRTPLLDRFAGRIINLHLGLSPYYRGTATNFYPLVNEEPQFVGATVHLIDPGIDTGDILHHARPEITAGDMPHTVGCKAILAGIEKVLRSLTEFEQGRLRPIPQWPVDRPRLYLRRDFHPSHVVRLYELIEAGLFPKYVARAASVADDLRLVP